MKQMAQAKYKSIYILWKYLRMKNQKNAAYKAQTRSDNYDFDKISMLIFLTERQNIL